MENPNFEAIKSKQDGRNEKILSGFTPEQQEEIEKKRKILSSLAFFIGKDFEIPVELNEPGQGWHWDFKNNVIRIDPVDLLEKPMDYLRFVISHEGGHRRISRTNFIPEETWKQPGFSFMMNSIEDPRDNNFVADSYPKFREQMDLAYKDDLDIEEKSIERAKQKLGYQPRFMQAGFEYIKQWFAEEIGEKMETSEELPDDVREVVGKTIQAARDSWWRYPSKDEADSSEKIISQYAEASYKINLKKIWPAFQKLVEKDLEDQKMQEFMKDMRKEKGASSNGAEIPQDLKEKLSPEEQKELKEAIDKAIEENKEKPGSSKEAAGEKGGDQEVGGVEQTGEDIGEADKDREGAGGTPVDIDSLSDELKEKIKEYIDSLSEDQKKELAEKAGRAIKDFEDEINKELQGKLLEEPGQSVDPANSQENQDDENTDESEVVDFSQREQERFRKNLENIFSESKDDPYRKALKQIAPLIDNLTGDLRDIFIKRKQQNYEAEYRSGKRWNVKKRIKEISAGIPLFKSEAREQKNIESEEKDYAITLLIDLSGSMRGNGKINEAFKSTILWAEVLHNLDIKFEIVGFQDRLIEFKKFEADFNDEMKAKMNQILLEVSDSNPGGNNNCGDNNDGECLLGASDHLEKQMAGNKFLIVLSDGAPAMDSGRKSQSQLHKELKEAVKYIEGNTGQKIIGIGLLSQAVQKYYSNNIPNVSTKELAEILGSVIREIIENY